ncbi:MAG: cyclophane-containing peptide 2OG-Fe(II) oxygenase YhhC [Flavobacterium sp.]|nr:cyclophane-containing peptide 2OG-Fe(II) oxygenase YhhC [Flavobacterium sp.]
MSNETILNFSNISIDDSPFRHFSSVSALNGGLDKELFKWFEETDKWGYTETDFYTQYEFSLFDTDIPVPLECLLDRSFIIAIENEFKKVYNSSSLELVGVTAHKLVDGYKMGVHNDFIGEQETHRFLIQINSNWQENNGGYLMLFNSTNADDVSKIILPLNNTGFGFEISPKSYHAVSTVYDFCRYTLVYTFKTVK